MKRFDTKTINMMVSYYSENELEKAKTVQDSELNDMLQEIRLHEPRFYLLEREFMRKRWFKTEKKVLYSVLYDTDHGCQILNFCQDHEGSINSYVTKSYIYTFFSAWLDGYERGKRKALISLNLVNEQ